MKLGICTRYYRHEATYAATRLATFAKDAGHDVSFFPLFRGGKANGVDASWDGQVEAKWLYSSWAEEQSHIIYTHVPRRLHVEFAKEMNVRSSVLMLWNDWDVLDTTKTETYSTLHLVDQVICPSRACYNVFSTVFRNCWYMPWDGGNPIYQRDPCQTVARPKILLPLWDGASNRMEMTILQLVRNTLHEFPNVSFVIPYSKRCVHITGVRDLKAIKRCFPDRVTLLSGVLPDRRFACFQQCDLTLYPTHHENLGLNVSNSLEAGTPVVAFGAAPVAELLTDNNGICVPCPMDRRSPAYGSIQPNYQLLQVSLFSLLQDSAKLCGMQQATFATARARRAVFEKQGALLLQG